MMLNGIIATAVYKTFKFKPYTPAARIPRAAKNEKHDTEDEESF
jgi:hypothetical protein